MSFNCALAYPYHCYDYKDIMYVYRPLRLRLCAGSAAASFVIADFDQIKCCEICRLNETEKLSSYQRWLIWSLSTSCQWDEGGAACAHRRHFPTAALLCLKAVSSISRLQWACCHLLPNNRVNWLRTGLQGWTTRVDYYVMHDWGKISESSSFGRKGQKPRQW